MTIEELEEKIAERVASAEVFQRQANVLFNEVQGMKERLKVKMDKSETCCWRRLLLYFLWRRCTSFQME